MRRHTHRKRVSALRLSSDTTSTLPVYIPDDDDPPPPDYPDSAEEADADTDSSEDYGPAPISAPPAASFSTNSPRRQRRFTHKRRQSTDPYLDSLLARSVHALEMSNTLLQSSMSTQTTLSNIFADSPADDVLENSARGLSMRIQGRDMQQPKWAHDLAEITRGVDGLFADDSDAPSVSCSLPTTSTSPMKQAQAHRRRPSLLEFSPHLHLTQQDRVDSVSPPPRAMTQYVVSSSDPNSIYLPSTLGARASHSSSSLNLHAPLSSPQLTDRTIEPATPAYNMLSSFVTPSPRRRCSTPSPSFKSKSTDTTPKQILTTLPHHRPMTPPTEESSSDGCPAKLTVLSLRKILDEQPPPAPAPSKRLKAPAFMPRTPAPTAEAGTSTATASISRLYTKGKHTASTRAPSPPRQSAMKQLHPPRLEFLTPPTSTGPSPSPSPSPSIVSFTEFLGIRGMSLYGSGSGAAGSGNASSGGSSGRSTPKRISFAALPESYAGSRGGGIRRKTKKSVKKSGIGKGGEEEEGGSGWWSGWLAAAAAVPHRDSGLGIGGRGDERGMDERLGRGWGGRLGGAAGFGPGMEEWGI